MECGIHIVLMSDGCISRLRIDLRPLLYKPQPLDQAPRRFVYLVADMHQTQIKINFEYRQIKFCLAGKFQLGIISTYGALKKIFNPFIYLFSDIAGIQFFCQLSTYITWKPKCQQIQMGIISTFGALKIFFFFKNIIFFQLLKRPAPTVFELQGSYWYQKKRNEVFY